MSENNHYTIVKDFSLLSQFINKLPDNTEQERYLIFLFARKKYNYVEGLTADKCQLKRLLLHKSDIISEIEKLEVKSGLYKFGDIIIPQENLVVYIQPNPRSLQKAMTQSIKDGIDLLAQNGNMNLKSIFYNNCQKFASTKIFYILDIDFKVEDRPYLETKAKIQSLIGNCGTFIATKNGVHGLVELSKMESAFRNTWYKNLSQLNDPTFDITMNADNPCAIPGCVQSTFTPYFI